MSINDIKSNLFYFAHRGAPWVKDENTISGFNKAISLGCQGIEMDVQKTLDNHIIIFHDDYIVFKNSTHKISELTYSTIKYMLNKKNKASPPLFNSIIPIIKQNPKIIFDIEIKSTKIINSVIIRHIKKQLTTNNVIDQCIISSFNYFLLLQIKLLFNEPRTALIMGKKRLIPLKTLRNKLLIKALNPNYIHANWKYLDNNLVVWLQNKNIGIHVYTVNTTKIQDKMINRGINILFTDNHRLYSNNGSKD